MGTTTTLNLPPAEAAHVEIMRAVAKDIQDLPMVLKGGTALLLCYGLDRFSEDLDFDAPKKFSLVPIPTMSSSQTASARTGWVH